MWERKKCWFNWIENIVGKGQNAGNQHFLLFTHCFQKFSLLDLCKTGNKIMIYVYVKYRNIVGKGENAGYQYFLLFPQCFEKVTLSTSASAFNLDQSKIFSSGKQISTAL